MGYGPPQSFWTGLWGSFGLGFHFELASGGGSGTHHLFGLGEWAGRPVFLTLSDTKITQLLMGLAIKNSFIHRLKILPEKI